MNLFCSLVKFILNFLDGYLWQELLHSGKGRFLPNNEEYHQVCLVILPRLQ